MIELSTYPTHGLNGSTSDSIHAWDDHLTQTSQISTGRITTKTSLFQICALIIIQEANETSSYTSTNAMYSIRSSSHHQRNSGADLYSPEFHDIGCTTSSHRHPNRTTKDSASPYSIDRRENRTLSSDHDGIHPIQARKNEGK